MQIAVAVSHTLNPPQQAGLPSASGQIAVEGQQ
jgi:hypothetical protein